MMVDRYAVIGNPVVHSKSPWIHAQFARQTGQAIEYGAILAPMDGFSRAIADFRAAGGRGANITLPFKQEAFQLATRASVRAHAARAVNTMVFDGDSLFGDNTDGAGLIGDLRRNSVLTRGQARAADGRGRCGARRRVPLLNRGQRDSRSRIGLSTALARAAISTGGRGLRDFAREQFDLAINATGGVARRASSRASAIFASALAYEMVYGRDTPFLRLAREAGAAASDGLGMLVEQAAESFLLWRGVRPDTASVLAALRGT